MTNAIVDENRTPIILATSNADGVTPLMVCANPVNHAMCANNGTTGSGTTLNDIRDENRKIAFMAVSSGDGATPVPIFIDSVTNKLLVTNT